MRPSLSCNSRNPARPARRGTRGFGLLEALIGGGVLALALLGHVAGTITGHHMSREEQVRSAALQTIRQFVEALRSDEDWNGLHGRLRALQVQAEQGTSTPEHLSDGRGCWFPQTYYADLDPALDDMYCLIEVPARTDLAGKAVVLREDQVDPDFLLPGDLNGNGTIESNPCNDFVFLPVVINFRWEVVGQGPREMRVSTWLRGER